MKGKNKLIIALFAVVALVVASVGFALNQVVEKIRYATATSVEAFTAELEGGVIFSAERVYFAVDENGKSAYDDRHKPVSYQGYNFNAIQTNKGTEYFGDYGLRKPINDDDNTHKHIIADGDFVMVDDNAVHTANVLGADDVSIKQGIMITLGGYFKYEDDIITNSAWKDDGDGVVEVGEVVGWTDNNSDGIMDAGEVEGAVDINGNGVIDVDELPGIGAGMGYVSAQAFRNGRSIEIPSARGYNNSSCQDFTWFILPDDDTEGHYQINFSYMINGETLRYDFDFYLLLQSSYEQEVEVTSKTSTHTYTSKPTMSNYENKVDNVYNFLSGKNLNYPTVTFDYSRYDLEYTHISGDVTTTVKFDYDEANQTLSLASRVYNDEDIKPYIIDTDRTNTIVTLMFVDHGKYDLHFDYIYKYQGEKIVIPQEQIAFENMTLNIYGYQLKYSKAGFASADMTYLKINKNNTMFILVNGYQNADNEAIGDSLGVQYEFVKDTTKPTGVVDIDFSKTASVFTNDLVTVVNGLNYQKTDRGLWLTLNDEYYLKNGTDVQSYYYYNPNKKITENFINGLENKDGVAYAEYHDNSIPFTKVTTFTAPGYYLVQVKYDYDPGTAVVVGTQYFAFQITSTVPVLNLYKTELETLSGELELNENYFNFYAHEYTNQNVYADWADTEIFESSVVGKLYYSAGKYASESTLKAVADGSYNSAVTKVDYNKSDLIKDSGAYLLVLEVERSATKTYTYFTIDKEAISGLQVYEVATNSVDNRAIYSIKQDSSLNYIEHTSKSVIDSIFTLNWADKNSGAGITAKYYFTPFIKTNQSNPLNNTITIQQGSNIYKYIINQYGIGQRTNEIEIHKPIQLNSALDVNNVLTDQGIYEFNLVDQAGNQLTYIVVVDRTEGVINATYGENKNPYISGQMVADYVELEWGTHKAISLGDTTNETINKLLNNQDIDNYYEEKGNNLLNLRGMFQKVSGNNLFIVENVYTEIKLRPFDAGLDNYYVITSNGYQQIKYPNGVTTTGWDTMANKVFDNVTNSGIKINIDEEFLRNYTFEVVGKNQVTNTNNTNISVRITPDKAQGEVYSSSQESADFNTTVLAHGEATKYFNDIVNNNNVNITKYYNGQASNDGVFVFEWLIPSDEDNFKVTEVKYNYYQLMDQNTLNKLPSKDGYPYYPYNYISTNYILQTKDGIEEVSQYEKGTRISKDAQGNVIETKSINRSNAINLAYETYYDANGNLISKKVTQTGLYIITRTISMDVDDGAEVQTSEFSYAFFVDRNMIVGYSITDINEKIVGQFIHNAMPNSESATGVKYDNFNKQGLKTQSQTYIESNNKENTIEYKVYLETNKLPTRLHVPSGKYVSGNVDKLSDEYMTINATSHLNLKLKLSVYFLDTYKILPNSYNGSFVRLMSNATSSKDGYIDLSFKNIDNEGVLTEFKNARIHAEDGSLSLPGVYVFVINDTVSSKVNDNLEVYDTNEFVFGIKLTNKAPETDVYSYAQVGSNSSDKVYADGNELYTNQEFVDFVIPVEDLKSYNAQLDIASIEIWRASSEYGGNSLWLRLKSSAGGNGFIADTNAIIQNLDRVEVVYKDGAPVNYIIHLDTGLVVENGQIVDYKEYTYIVNIQYVLKNSGTKYYTYKDEGFTTSFHTSTYTVVIDRTPNNANLDALMQEQGGYFEDYHAWLAEQNNTQATGGVNKEFAYRSTKTIGDYYGLSNSLYYQFAENTGTLSNQAMYALNVNYGSTFNPDGLTAIYYRKLDFNSNVIANTRMGLLPITNTYYETAEYYTFNENLTAYSFYSAQNQAHLDSNGNIYYYAIMSLSKDANNSYETSYNDNCGSFYEIVEKDHAGNYTQYVVYFAPQTATPVQVKVAGDLVYPRMDDDETITLTSEINSPRTFIGVDIVTSLSGLVSANADEKYPYYANINIYNASREKIKTIYTNSISKHATLKNAVVNGQTVQQYDKLGIESEIYNVIKEQGNYIIEYVNVFGESFTAVINNYTSDNHKLNTSTLEVKEDYVGQKYITFSGLNTKIDENTYWYVTEIKITYHAGEEVVYVAEPPQNGKTTLLISRGNESEVWRDLIEFDRLNLAKGIQYLVILTDVGGNKYSIPLSTSEDYYAYKLITPENVYNRDNIVYTANQIQISYNTDFYEVNVDVYLDGNTIRETFAGDDYKKYYDYKTQAGSYRLLTLIPDNQTDPANHYGELRRFVVTLILKSADNEVSQSYEIYIDTRTTNFVVENTNKVDKINFIKSTLKNGVDENGNYRDYNIMELRNSVYYKQLIAETVNISWTRLTSDYFTYNYELFEFENAVDEPKELLGNSGVNIYNIAPKENTTGKYVLKVTINSKDGRWIATRVFGIYMSTTITGWYEVKDGDGVVYDYSAITNLDEVINSIGSNKTAMATALGFSNITEMDNVFNNGFGTKTAIPMYIANTQLTLHSNQDNGVSSKAYYPEGTSYAKIAFYRVYTASNQTFAVIMEVYPNDKSQNILSTLSFTTNSTQDGETLLNSGTAKTIYNQNAEFYKLTFNSYNRNTGSNPLERHNRIIIDVYYNNVFAKRIKGGDGPTTTIEFKNSGSYKLEIRDEAGNIQYFSSATATLDNFTVIVMKDMLYTVNGEAPIQYAYYSGPVTLQINRYNEATGKNNYDINTIQLKAILNSAVYTGYEHPAESATYIFKEYGTYLITIEADLLQKGDDGETIHVVSQIVFTILNPDEARTAIDFTSICGYNIISVFNIGRTSERDVTNAFVNLLQDKSNTGEINVYNKLITYERLVDVFGTSTRGKMKFRVLYEVENDDLLPARRAEFTFTLNNETASITSSIKAGGKTTKDVTLKFNAANIYDKIGDCKLVINGEVVLRIDKDSINEITEIKVNKVGHYYVQLMGDSGNVSTSFDFTIKEPLNTVAIILIVVISAIVIALIGTFIWLRTRMKVR